MNATAACPSCPATVTLLTEHPPYPLPHGHGYPAYDAHLRPGTTEPCRASGQWVRTRLS
jgi:hypothetical protein